MNLEKDSNPSIIESCGGLPETEDADLIVPLPKSAGLFNQGSQATVNDDTRSAAFGGFNQSQTSFAEDGFTFPSQFQQQQKSSGFFQSQRKLKKMTSHEQIEKHSPL